MANSDKPGDTEAPRALKIVALLFAFGGGMSALTMLLNLFEGTIKFDLDIVQFWMAGGLLRLNRKWLTWSKRLIWFNLIVIDIVSLFLATNQTDSKFKFGPIAVNMSDTQALLLFLATAALSLWQLRVLTRPEIDELFVDEAEKPTVPQRRFESRSEPGLSSAEFGHSALPMERADRSAVRPTPLEPESRQAPPLPVLRKNNSRIDRQASPS